MPVLVQVKVSGRCLGPAKRWTLEASLIREVADREEALQSAQSLTTLPGQYRVTIENLQTRIVEHLRLEVETIPASTHRRIAVMSK